MCVVEGLGGICVKKKTSFIGIFYIFSDQVMRTLTQNGPVTSHIEMKGRIPTLVVSQKMEPDGPLSSKL